MTVDTPDQTAVAVHFDAVLHPHRSLRRSGFALLMGVLAGASLIIGLIFLMMGAWPVMGFFGLDILLIYVAFRLNYQAAELYETVRLTDRQLVVWRIARKAEPKSWVFEPTWLRVSMDDPPGHNSQVILSSHGRSLVVGSFLTPDERLEFAKALKEALHQWRSHRLSGQS